MKRLFLGTGDLQQVVLRSVFFGSPLVVVAPVESPRQTYLQIEGPEYHLAFLYPHLVMLVKQSPYDFSGAHGTWIGVEGAEHTGKLSLFYRHGDSFEDRVQLLEHHFRCDIAFYRNIRLADVSFIDVICGGRRWLYNEVVSLPEELEENGSIEFPRLRLA